MAALERPRLRLTVALCAWLAGCGAPSAHDRPANRTEGAGLTVADVLGGSTDGYAIADGGLVPVFPRDHGPHPDYRNEWWYLTGNLEAADRQLGYQLTLFRTAIAPEPVESTSAWATRQVYMAHFALGDLGASEFRAYDRFSRAALGLAGAQTDPLRVWLEDWEIAYAGEAEAPAGGPDPGALAGLVPLRVRAAEGDVAIDLRLDTDRPPVLHGSEGLSRKGSRPANASYYYSATRLRTTGTVTIGDRRLPVRGLSWLDREWSTSALEEGQVGWDWFSLQLDDGTDLMLYLMRRADGSVDPHSSGTFVTAEGSARQLAAGEFAVRASDSWTSPRTGTVYPSGWVLEVPSLGLTLTVEPRMRDQEIDLVFRYWEGAVAVRGSRGATAVAGHGFVELTGY